MRVYFIPCVLSALLLAAAPPSGGTVSPTSIRTQFESDPTMGEMFRALRDDYPDEYERLVSLTVEGTEEKRSDAEMKQRGFDEMRGFMRTKLPMIERAPAADLRALGLAYAALMHTLQRDDTGLCARFAIKGFQATDTISPDAMKAMVHVNALQVHAMRHVEASPAAERGPLAQRDAAAFMAAVVKESTAVAPLLRDQAKLNAASDQDKCALGVAIYDAVASLPEAQAANLTAYLIVNAAKS
jgi:hypothetical protein